MTEEATSTDVSEEDSQSPEHISFAEFLESYPSHSIQHVTGYYEKDGNSNRRQAPVVRLHCPTCGGIRNFAGDWVHERWVSNTDAVKDFLKYTCRDCRDSEKTFCLMSQATDNEGNGCAVKVGEIPEMHVDLPRSLKKLLGDDYKIFLKGLTCEKRGLGIGAFTYYRRVVESQKGHLIQEIHRVAVKLGAPEAIQDQLKSAAKEQQFTRAIDGVKGAIPESLLVDSHNPLKLLHQALSIGVHAEDDDSCLKIAHSIRMVLVDLSERIKLALQEQSGLRSALSDLMTFNAEAKKKKKESQQEH